MGCLAINSFIDPILNYINTDKNIKKYFDFTGMFTIAICSFYDFKKNIY